MPQRRNEGLLLPVVAQTARVAEQCRIFVKDQGSSGLQAANPVRTVAMEANTVLGMGGIVVLAPVWCDPNYAQSRATAWPVQGGAHPLRLGFTSFPTAKPGNENERACGMTRCHKLAGFRTRFLQLESAEMVA